MAHEERLLMASESPTVFEAKGLSRRFTSNAETVDAVRNVNLAASSGEFLCIYGASGSGKSTLLRLIGGLDQPTSGTIAFGDEILSSASSERLRMLRLQRIAVVFQDHNLINEFSAVENVALPLELQGIQSRDARLDGNIALEKVGLGGFGHRFPSELSGGQQQRVGIARALVGGRSLLLADEPSGSLDSDSSRELFVLLRTLCDEQALTAVICTHDPLAQEFSDRTLLMADGMLSPEANGQSHG